MSSSEEKKKTAPYISFQTFQSGLDAVANAGVPNIIDRHSFKSFSGGAVAAVLSSFRFFNLIDSAGKPAESLKPLAENKDARKQNIRTLLEYHYDTVIALDLLRATPGQMDEAFSNSKYNVTGATKRKAQAFFLKAAAFADIPIGTLLMSKSRNVSTSRKPRKKKPEGETKTGNQKGSQGGEVPQGDGIVHGQAIKTVDLAESKKTVWLGTDANLVEVKFGRDLDFVVSLMKLFDIYERGGNATVSEKPPDGSGSQGSA